MVYKLHPSEVFGTTKPLSLGAVFELPPSNEALALSTRMQVEQSDDEWGKVIMSAYWKAEKIIYIQNAFGIFAFRMKQ